jgi:putative peptidoglycan lipid II flippase
MENQSVPPEPSQRSRLPGLLRATGLVSLMTLLSRVLGLVRDVTVAHLFGAGTGADAFFVAFKIPNFFRRLFAEGAFAQAFVPVLSEYRTLRDHVEVRLLIAQTSGVMLGVLSLLTVLVVAIAPWVVMLFAPGFHAIPEKLELAGDLLRYTFPYLLLISLTAFAGSVLNSYGRFGVPAFTPVWLNLCLIAAAFWLAPFMDPPILALGVGVLIAGCVQLVFQLPFLYRMQLLPKPVWGWNSSGVIRIRRLMLPALFGVSVAQINLLLDTLLASFLQNGSVSWLYYSDRLMELPLGVFGIAIATVILPSLSRQHAAASTAEFARLLDWAVRWVLLIGVPAALALLVLAEPLLVTLFQYGAFTQNDVLMAAQSLRAYGLGLLGFMLIKVLAPGYFARQDTATPVRIGIVALGANMVFNLLLIWPLAHAGLALATTLSAFLNAALLWRGLLREGVYVIQSGWRSLLVQLSAANVALAGMLLWLAPPLESWFAMAWWSRAIWMTGLVVAGLVVYAGVLLLMGVRPGHLRLDRH